MFKFPVKLTLTSVDKRPGELYFSAWLKCDTFDIHLQNLNIINVLGITEGHCLNTKDPISATSTLRNATQVQTHKNR